MIICHPLKLIFLKTKKVGGTSFEIALSHYCSNECIITRIASEDEQIRQDLGFAGPRNYRQRQRIGYKMPGHANQSIRGNFANHVSARHVHKHVGDRLWAGYTKISIYRDPVEFLVSEYFYRFRKRKRKPDFFRWAKRNMNRVTENYDIAPAKGPDKMDIILSYEDLETGIRAHMPEGFFEIFSGIGAKSRFRASHSRDRDAFFKGHEDQLAAIEALARTARQG